MKAHRSDDHKLTTLERMRARRRYGTVDAMWRRDRRRVRRASGATIAVDRIARLDASFFAWMDGAPSWPAGEPEILGPSA